MRRHVVEFVSVKHLYHRGIIGLKRKNMKPPKVLKTAHVHFGEMDSWVTIGTNSTRYDGSIRGELQLMWDLFKMVFRTRKTTEWKFTTNDI
jgi:hypothetical protein